MDTSGSGSRRFRTRSRSRRRKKSSLGARLLPDFDLRNSLRNTMNTSQMSQKHRDSDEELDPKTMEFSDLVQFLHPSFIYDYLQKILQFLQSDKMELCFPNIALYKETFLVKIANDNKRLMCACLNDASRELGRQILAVIEENRNIYRWIHIYENRMHERVVRNVLVYKKMFYNEKKAPPSSTSEFKTPGPVPAYPKCLSSHFESLELTNRKDQSFDNPCTAKRPSRSLHRNPSTEKDLSIPRNLNLSIRKEITHPLDPMDEQSVAILKKLSPRTVKDVQNPAPSTKKDQTIPCTMKIPRQHDEPSTKKDLQIPTTLKITLLNSTIKFLKNENLLTLALPQMTIEQAHYFASIINETDRSTNVGFGYQSLYAPLYTALEETRGEFDVKTIMTGESLSGNMRMLLRKIPKDIPKDVGLNVKCAPESLDKPRDIRDIKSMDSRSRDASKERISEHHQPKDCHLTKAQKDFLIRQKTVNALSESFIKTSLQRILDFVDDHSRASLEFDKINLEESSFLQMVFSLSRQQEYYKLFNDDCVVLLKKIYRVERYETQHRKQWKINTQVARLHKFTRLGNVVFEKTPTGVKKQQKNAQISHEFLGKSGDGRESKSNTDSSSRDISKERSLPDIAQRLMALSTRCDSTPSLNDSTEHCGLGLGLGNGPKNDKDKLNRSTSKDRSASERSESRSRRNRQRKNSKERRQPSKYNIAFQSAGSQLIDCTSTVNSDTNLDPAEVKKLHFGRKKKLIDDLSIPVDIDKAKRMMHGMGWDGGPLGARGEGIIEPIMPALHLAPGAGLGHIKTVSRSTSEFRMSMLTTLVAFVTGPNKETSVSFTQPLTKRELRFIRPTLQAFNCRKPVSLKLELMDLVKRILEEMLCQPLLLIECEVLDQNREIRFTKAEGIASKSGKKRHKRSSLTTTYSAQSVIPSTASKDSHIITTDQILNLDLPVKDYSHKAYKNLACKVTFLEKIKGFLQLKEEKKEYVCDFILNNKQRDYIHQVVTLVNQRDSKYKFGTWIENDIFYSDIKKNINNCFMTVIFSGQKFVLHKRFYQKRFTNSALDQPTAPNDDQNRTSPEMDSVRRVTDKPQSDRGDTSDISSKSEGEREIISRDDKKRDKKRKEKEIDKNNAGDDEEDFLMSDRDDILIIDNTDNDFLDTNSESDSDTDSKDDTGEEYKDWESDCDDIKDVSDESLLLDMLEKENESMCLSMDTNSPDKDILESDLKRHATKNDKSSLKHLTPYMESHTPPHDLKLDLFDVECVVANNDSIEYENIIYTHKGNNTLENNGETYQVLDENFEADDDLSLTPPLAELDVKVKATQEAKFTKDLKKNYETTKHNDDVKENVKTVAPVDVKIFDIKTFRKELETNLNKGVAAPNKLQEITIDEHCRNLEGYRVLDEDLEMTTDNELDLESDEHLCTELLVREDNEDKELRSDDIECTITGIDVLEFVKQVKTNEGDKIKMSDTKIEKQFQMETNRNKPYLTKHADTHKVDASQNVKKKLEARKITDCTTTHDNNAEMKVVEDLYANVETPVNKYETKNSNETEPDHEVQEMYTEPKVKEKEKGLSINEISEIAKFIEGKVDEVDSFRETTQLKVRSHDLLQDGETEQQKLQSPDLLGNELLKSGSLKSSKEEISQDSDIKSDQDLSEEYLTPGESIEKLNEVEMDCTEMEQDKRGCTMTLQGLGDKIKLEFNSKDLNESESQISTKDTNIDNFENDLNEPKPTKLADKGKILSNIVVIDYKNVDGEKSPTFRFYDNLEGYISELSIKKETDTKDQSIMDDNSENCEIPEGSEAILESGEPRSNNLGCEVNNNGSDKTDSRLTEEYQYDSKIIVENQSDSKLFVENDSKQFAENPSDLKDLVENQNFSEILVKTQFAENTSDTNISVENQSDLKVIEKESVPQNLDQNGCNLKTCENLILKRALSKDSLHIESSPSSSKRSRSDSENSDRISKRYKYVIPKKVVIMSENLDMTVDLVKTIQNCISEGIEESITLPLLECNGIQNGGLIYTCYNEQTLIWLKKLINSLELNFKMADTEVVEEKTYKLQLKMNSFIQESKELILNRLELFNTGLNTNLWEVVDSCASETFKVLVVRVDDDSYNYISENNFALFAGVTKAYFTVIRD